MSRNTFAKINLAALKSNFMLMQGLAPNSKTIAVIKADAYGNGAVQVATALANNCDMFAVAFLDEVLALRHAGITNAILLLEGPQSESECLLVRQQLAYGELVWMLHSQHQLRWLDRVAKGDVRNEVQPRCWVKVDSGMHRLGFLPEQLPSVIDMFPHYFNEQTTFCTHLATADEPNNSFALKQINIFTQCMQTIARQYPHVNTDRLCLFNSAGVSIFNDQVKAEWNRVGIALYGSTPFSRSDTESVELELQTVMSLVTSVVAIRTVSEGDSVGYGQTWVASKPTIIATLAIGYADGYPRHAPIGTPAFCNGQRISLVGRVSMDMITFDVTTLDNVDIGDVVELWGENVSINEIADHVGTIGYELMTRVSSRVPRRFVV